MPKQALVLVLVLELKTMFAERFRVNKACLVLRMYVCC